jgi:axin 1
VYKVFLLRFACQGLKKQPRDQTEKIFQLIKVINRKFLRSKVVPIAEETRKVIQEKIGSKDSGQDIFDTAQLEVEDRMTRTTYRNFLASEAYLNYVQMMQTGETLLTKTATKERGEKKFVILFL